ncbi:MAG: hypothetical protein HOD35_00950, partial [Euryarchaeota archaeon]|nr:hypothetical protein [Euryarchaeota archaeon]
SNSNTGSELSPFSTIQFAIDIAASGDTILINPGSYSGGLSSYHKSLTIGSLFLTTGDTSHVSNTIIDASNSWGIDIGGSSEDFTTKISGLTIKNGNAQNSSMGYGSGIRIEGYHSVIVDRCVIKENSDYAGSGISVFDNVGRLKVTNSIIKYNENFGGNGAGINVGMNQYSNIGRFDIRNSIIANNTGATDGGGICSYADTTIILNCTVGGNEAGFAGGICFYNFESDSSIIMNSIVSQNLTSGSTDNAQFYQDENGGPIITINNYSNGYEFNAVRTLGNISSKQDPFVDIQNGDFNLKNSSPAIGGAPNRINSFFGELVESEEKDIYDRSRPFPLGSVADIGAVESSLGKKVTRFFVANDGSNNNNGTSDFPFGTVQYAINNVAYGDTVILQPGTYQENVDFNGISSITLSSLFLLSGDKSHLESTIVDGNGQNAVFFLDSHDGESEITLNISGLTLTGGDNDGGPYGGGLFVSGIDTLILNNMIIDGNYTSINGNDAGGITVRGTNYVKISNSTISNNIADRYSGLAVSQSAEVELFNILVHSNSNPDTYHSVFLHQLDELKVVNSTIANNTVEVPFNSGGMIINMNSTLDSALVMNSIISQNKYLDEEGEQFTIGENFQLQFQTGKLVLINNYTEEGLVEGDSKIKRSSGNIFSQEDPFVDLINDNYALTNFTKAIGGGKSSISFNGETITSPNFDMVGSSRPNPEGTDGDIGALENSLGEKLNTIYTVKQDGTGDYTTIQSGVNGIDDGDTLLVHPGTYYENIMITKQIVLESEDGAGSTIIDASGSGTVLKLNNFSTADYYGYPDIHSDIIVDGFTIQNGSSIGSGNTSGGIIIGVSNSIVKNCVIKNNNSHDGGGSFAEGGTFVNCTFIGNTSEFEGGAIKMASRGFSGFESVSVTSCLIAENNCSSGSGLFGQFNINSSTIVSNIGGAGIGVSGADSGPSIIRNSIIYGNSSEGVGSFDADITYSLVEGGYLGTGNIDLNPLFVDSENGNYHLSDYSPAIGSGTSIGAQTTDIEGNPRPNPSGSNPDLGAYENSRSIPQNISKYYVSNSGSASGSGLSNDFMLNIQDAINAASNGDTVLVDPGTYTENINYNGKNIV